MGQSFTFVVKSILICGVLVLVHKVFSSFLKPVIVFLRKIFFVTGRPYHPGGSERVGDNICNPPFNNSLQRDSLLEDLLKKRKENKTKNSFKTVKNAQKFCERININNRLDCWAETVRKKLQKGVFANLIDVFNSNEKEFRKLADKIKTEFTKKSSALKSDQLVEFYGHFLDTNSSAFVVLRNRSMLKTRLETVFGEGDLYSLKAQLIELNNKINTKSVLSFVEKKAILKAFFRQMEIDLLDSLFLKKHFIENMSNLEDKKEFGINIASGSSSNLSVNEGNEGNSYGNVSVVIIEKLSFTESIGCWGFNENELFKSIALFLYLLGEKNDIKHCLFGLN